MIYVYGDMINEEMYKEKYYSFILIIFSGDIFTGEKSNSE